MTPIIVNVDDSLMARLRAKAEREAKSVEAVARAALENAIPPADAPDESGGNLFLMLAELADQFEPISDRDDIAQNFDAIIGSMMAEDFRQRHEAGDSA